MNFYGLDLDQQQEAFVKAIVVGHTGQVDITGRSGFAKYIEHFRGQGRTEICELTTNYRGWLSSYADLLPEE